ncbi:cell envelope integrity protein TolA [Psychrobacter sp. I-STPA10]|uniref:cell envelope integrity protein TolA n=1 Tax=Psychrobacter sp. I-STPA10 TaxID=2585769 RepID=UPI001E2F2B51|nr:cell envelope integrity protein TolA [Psychrobacter sp. I-STPA10]
MPSVYVPVEPEDNGLGIPMVLSILIHAAIIGFVFFTHRVPKMDIPASIETSIVTPEELAAMQAGIKANRAAGEEGNQGEQSSQTFDTNLATNNSNRENNRNRQPTPPPPAQNTEVRRHSVPIFIPTNEPTIDNIDSAEIDTRLDTTDIKELEYERRRQIFSEQMEKEAEQNLQDFASDVADKNIKEKERLGELKAKKPKIEKPKRIEKDFAPIESGDSHATNSWSLGDDGDPLLTGNTGNTGSAKGAQGRSGGSQSGGGNIDGALISHIEPYWHPPKNRVGERVVADVTVDANGNVLSIKVNSADNELKSSLDSAIRNASPLTPIQGTDKRRLRLHFVVK